MPSDFGGFEPRATYRLQLGPDLSFAQAAEAAPYLRDLGVSHVYLSPCTAAAAGSTHGYDVVDCTRVSDALGGEADFLALLRRLRELGLGVLLDVVPNHMALTSTNRYAWDVLLRGEASPYARFFDIDWDHRDPRLRGKLVLPILGDRYQKVLSSGQIQLQTVEDAVVLRVYDQHLPVQSAPPPDEDALRAINQDPVALDALLQRQHYALMYWRSGIQALNYRRFFNISNLIALRASDPDVFDQTHAKVLSWVQSGKIQGLRIDHIDGLAEPKAYLQRLRRQVPESWIVVEKILEPDETLPRDWPVQGTTGYDFLRQVDALFVDPAGEPPLSQLYAQSLAASPGDFADIARASKRLVLRQWFQPDLERLADLAVLACAERGQGRDYTRGELKAGLAALLVNMPVYRTYRTCDGPMDASDRARLQHAATRSCRDADLADPGAIDVLVETLSSDALGSAACRLALAFQQLSGPVMAKGVEDTAFYRFHRLSACNEVGCDPGHFGGDLAAFHQFCADMHARWPRSLLASSTHDTKRGEDTRLTLFALSEVAAEWAQAVQALWPQLRDRTQGCPVDDNTLYLLLQSWLGAFPAAEERLAAFMLKAAREAKEHTSWMHQDAAYERNVREAVRLVLSDATAQHIVARFAALARPAARLHGLSMTLLKLTAPGVPDIYQGSELWNYSLADPDNRRRVDFARNAGLLARVDGMSFREARGQDEEGLSKLWLIRQVLALRQRHPAAFGPGEGGRYRPLSATGIHGARVVAFTRGERLLIAAPRLTLGLKRGWEDTALTLPPGRHRDVLGDRVLSGEVRAEELFGAYGVVLCEQMET